MKNNSSKSVNYDYKWRLNAQNEVMAEFIKEYPNSYVSLYHLDKNSLSGGYNYEDYYEQYETLSNELKNTSKGQALGKKILATKSNLYGKSFLNFESISPEGVSFQMNDIIQENEFTLIDFWASWCIPCRKENPYVVKTYESFKNKGFNVISISLDKDKEKWIQAIGEDGMPWIHGCTFKAFDDPGALLYGVKFIPYNILIDKQGKVLAANLKGENLYKSIQSLVQK